MSSVSKMLFEVEYANRALPLVEAIVRDVVADFRKLRSISRRQRTLRAETDGSTTSLERLRRLGAEVEEISTRIEGYLRELDDLGLELRDLETGSVDFPTIMDGEPAYLCWHLGEGQVAWWHAASSGYADRQPIPQAVLGALGTRS